MVGRSGASRARVCALEPHCLGDDARRLPGDAWQGVVVKMSVDRSGHCHRAWWRSTRRHFCGAGGKPHQGVLLRGKSSHAQTISLLVALTLTLLAGCGGGGGGPTSGSGQIIEPPPPPDPVTITQATVRGTSATDLIDVLQDHASGGPWGPEGSTWQRWPQLPLWEGQPIVRVQSSASAEHQRMVASAVDLINDWLPLEHRMVIGAPTPLRTEDPADVPAGEIHVSFSSPHRGGQSRYNESGDRYRTDDVPRMVSNLVVVNPDFFATESRHEVYGALVHELVHAMGLPGHVYEGDHPTSLMPDGPYRGGGLPDEVGLPRLPRIDGEALMTAYALYDDGETHDDIDAASLGPWARTIPAVNGEVRTVGGTARFGVEYRAQWTRAWDEGPVPATPLANSPLTGTATWTGAMVGFTDAGTAVEGDAGIAVDIADMDGTAAFTDLMAGSASWGPNLSTAIGVTGNYFSATGSEPRLDVQGQFRGTGHEAATGVLRWEDTTTGNLTGAFGAIRE